MMGLSQSEACPVCGRDDGTHGSMCTGPHRDLGQSGDSPRVLVTAEDVDASVLQAVLDCLDWFDDAPGLNTEEFIDRLCDTYGDGWDIESYDTAAVRKIMRYAREARRNA